MRVTKLSRGRKALFGKIRPVFSGRLFTMVGYSRHSYRASKLAYNYFWENGGFGDD